MPSKKKQAEIYKAPKAVHKNDNERIQQIMLVCDKVMQTQQYSVLLRLS